MTFTADHWDAVAREKLERVFGAAAAEAMYARGLREIGRERLSSPGDLERFAQWLQTQTGFAAAVGGLLSVHAIVHGAAR